MQKLNGTVKWATITIASLAVLLAFTMATGGVVFGYGVLYTKQEVNTTQIQENKQALAQIHAELFLLGKGQSRLEQKVDTLVNSKDKKL